MKTYDQESEEQVRPVGRQLVMSEAAAAGDEPPRAAPGRFPGGAIRGMGGAARMAAPSVATPGYTGASTPRESWIRERTPLITRQSNPSEAQASSEQGVAKDLLRRVAWQLVWDVVQQLLDSVIPPRRSALAMALYRELPAIYAENASYRKKLGDLATVLQVHGQQTPTRGADDPALRGYLRVIAQAMTTITQEWEGVERLVRHVGEEETWLGQLTEVVRGVGDLLHKPVIEQMCAGPLLERLRQGVRPVQTLLDQVKAVWTHPEGAQWQAYLDLLVQQEALLPGQLSMWLKTGQQLSRLQSARPYPTQGTPTAQLTWIMEALSDPQVLNQAEGILGPEMLAYLKSVAGIGSDALRFPQDGGLVNQMFWLFQALGHLPGIRGTSVEWFAESLRQVLGTDDASRELFDLLMEVSDPKKSLWQKAWRTSKTLAFEAASGLGLPWIQSVAQNVCARVAASLGIPGPVISVISQAARSVTRDTKLADIPALLLGAASLEAHSQVLQYLSQSDEGGRTLRLAKVMGSQQSFEESVRYLVSEAEASDPLTRACQMVILHGQLAKEIAVAVQAGDMQQTEERLRLVARVLKEVGGGSAYQYLDKVIDLIPLIPALHQARQDVKGGADQSWLQWGEGLVQALERSSQSNKTMQQLREQLMQRITDWVAQALKTGLGHLGGAVMSRVGVSAAPTPAREGAPWAQGERGPVGASEAKIATPTVGSEASTITAPKQSRGPGRRLLAVEDLEQGAPDSAERGGLDTSWLSSDVIIDDDVASGDAALANWRSYAQWGSTAWASLGMLATIWSVMRTMHPDGDVGVTQKPAEQTPLHREAQAKSPDTEHKELLAPEKLSPYHDTTSLEESSTGPSTWQRLRMPIAMATFGVALPTALLAGLYWTQAEKEGVEEGESLDPLSTEELKAIVEDVDRLFAVAKSRRKRKAWPVHVQRHQKISAIVSIVMLQVPENLRSHAMYRLRSILSSLLDAYQKAHEGVVPSVAQVMIMADEYLLREQAKFDQPVYASGPSRSVVETLLSAVRSLLENNKRDVAVGAYLSRQEGIRTLGEIKRRYTAAYPMSLNFRGHAREILARKLKEAGSVMTPESKVTVDIWETGAISEYDSKPRQNYKVIKSSRYSLIDLAMGAVSKIWGADHPLEIFGLDEQAKTLFPSGSQYYGTGFRITGQLQKEIQADIKEKYQAAPAVKARGEIAAGGVNHALAAALIALDEKPNSSHRNAIENFLLGKVPAYSMKFNKKALKGVFAIPIDAQKKRWLCISSGMAGGVLEVAVKKTTDQKDLGAIKEWVLPHLDSFDYQKFHDKDSEFGTVVNSGVMGGRYADPFNRYDSPYAFEEIVGARAGEAGWQEKIAAKMVDIEHEHIVSDIDTAFYTSTEAWLDFADSRIRPALIMMSMALGAGASASALAVGARVAMLIGSVAVNLTDFALDAWRASLIKNDPQERNSQIAWAIAGALLGGVFDAKDLKTVIGQARAVLSKADDITKLADETFGLSSSVKGVGGAGGAGSKVALSQSNLDELAKRGIIPGEHKGRLYRGDTRNPEDIFNNGFKPQGDNYSLNNHLSFAGGSGFISFTRKKDVSMRYASGRTGEKVSEGYIYKIDRLDYSADIAGSSVKNDPAVKANQEVASIGEVPAHQIRGAYKVKFEQGKPPRIDDYYVNKNYRRVKGEGGGETNYHYPEAKEFTPVALPKPPSGFEVGYRTVSDNNYVHFYTKAKEGQEVGSDTLVVSAHGGYLNSDYGRDLVSLPPETTIKMLTPHDTFLSDPGLDFVVNQPNSYKAYVTLEGEVKEVHFETGNGNSKTFGDEYDPNAAINTLGNEAGTNQLLNYRHFQYEGESPQYIANVLLENRRLAGDVPQTDILVMNDLIKSGTEGLAADRTPTASVQTIIDLDQRGLLVNAQGQKYKTIVLSHCRNNLAAPDALTYNLKPEVVDIINTRGGRSFGVLGQTTLSRGSSGGDLQAKTEVKGILVDKYAKTASKNFPLDAPRTSTQMGIPDKSMLFSAHYKASPDSPGTDVCWDYAFDVLKRGHIISSDTVQALRTAAKPLSRGEAELDTLLKAGKYEAVTTLADLQRVAPGKLVIFMDGKQMKHAVVSMGDGVFSGKKNGILDPKISDAPQLVFAEGMVKEQGGRLVGENGHPWSIYAGDAKGATAAHPNVLADIPKKKEIDPVSNVETEKPLTRDETVLGKDATITTANGFVNAEFHGAPWISNTYMKVPDVASYIRTRVGPDRWKTIQQVNLRSCFAGFGGSTSAAQVMANELRKPVRATWKKFSGATAAIPDWGRVFRPQEAVTSGATGLHEMWSQFSRTTALPMMRAYHRVKNAMVQLAPQRQSLPQGAVSRTKRSDQVGATGASLEDIVAFIFGDMDENTLATRAGLPEVEKTHLESFPRLSVEVASSLSDESLLDYFFAIFLVSDELERQFIEIMQVAKKPAGVAVSSQVNED